MYAVIQFEPEGGKYIASRNHRTEEGATRKAEQLRREEGDGEYWVLPQEFAESYVNKHVPDDWHPDDETSPELMEHEY